MGAILKIERDGFVLASDLDVALELLSIEITGLVTSLTEEISELSAEVTKLSRDLDAERRLRLAQSGRAARRVR